MMLPGADGGDRKRPALELWGVNILTWGTIRGTLANLADVLALEAIKN
jgi:hypothetical protein